MSASTMVGRCWVVSGLAVGVLLAGGCATMKRNPVPADLVEVATVPGYQGLPIRMSHSPLGEAPDWKKLSEFTQGLCTDGGPDKVMSIMMISGGGENGAYGAGVLCGWSESGERPEFDVVTGISTGGLIAPLAFLGRDYDAALRRSYTEVEAKDIFDKLNLFSILHRRTSLADTKPLERMIASTFGEKELQAIAEEHRRGRRLYIGTADLDREAFILWDIGAIAVSGRSNAVALVHQVMLASASIPVAFPPVLFTVEANGKSYRELHVDGGTVAQVFGGAILIVHESRMAPAVPVRMYLLRNGKMSPYYAPPKMKLSSLAGRSLQTSGLAQSFNDVLRAYVTAREANAEFYMTSIPTDFSAPRKSAFDQEYMRALFDVGYKFGQQKGPWERKPKGFRQSK